MDEDKELTRLCERCLACLWNGARGTGICVCALPRCVRRAPGKERTVEAEILRLRRYVRGGRHAG